MTVNGVKQTVLDPNVLPQTVIYDPSLLSGLPLQAAACSGMNAIAHIDIILVGGAMLEEDGRTRLGSA